MGSGLIEEITLSVDTTGSDSSATGNDETSDEYHGWLLEVEVDYHESAPAGTTDVTLKVKNGHDLLVLTNAATDGTWAPRRPCCDTAGSAITNSFDKLPINGVIRAEVAGCNALTAAAALTVRVLTF